MRNDIISRQDAIDAFTGVVILEPAQSTKKYIDGVIERIQNLPSAQTEQRWIPCSERLPEEHDSFFAKFYGTDEWKPHMFRKTSYEVIVTTVFADGTKRTDTAHTHDGKWKLGIKAIQREVLAWMPLPEPWKGEA